MVLRVWRLYQSPKHARSRLQQFIRSSCVSVRKKTRAEGTAASQVVFWFKIQDEDGCFFGRAGHRPPCMGAEFRQPHGTRSGDPFLTTLSHGYDDIMISTYIKQNDLREAVALWCRLNAATSCVFACGQNQLCRGQKPFRIKKKNNTNELPDQPRYC